MQIMLPHAGLRIEDNQPVILRPDPDIAFPILRQGIDGVVGDTCSRVIPLLIVPEPARPPLITIEPAISPDPKTIPTVDKQRSNRVVIDRRGDIPVVYPSVKGPG